MNMIGHDDELAQAISGPIAKAKHAFEDVLCFRLGQNALAMPGVKKVVQSLGEQLPKDRLLLRCVRRRIGGKPLLTLILPLSHFLPRQAVGEPECHKRNGPILLKVGQITPRDQPGLIPIELANLGSHAHTLITPPRVNKN